MDKNSSLKIPGGEKAAPFVSGGASVWLLQQVLFSKLQGAEFYIGVGAALLLFAGSVILFYLLSKMEKDKDTEIIAMIHNIVEEVFGKYGVEMSRKNADRAPAGEMNTIMQTIVNLVAGMKTLVEKTYKK